MPIHLNIVRRLMGGSPTEVKSRKRSAPGPVLAVVAAAPTTKATVLSPSQHPHDYNDDFYGSSTFIADDDASSISDDEHIIAPKKGVQFASVEIREYGVIVGDHPCCSMGCPLALGWDYSTRSAQSLDTYEASRLARRNRSQLKTTREERLQMVESESGTSCQTEVKRADRRLYRERSTNIKVINRCNKKFFN